MKVLNLYAGIGGNRKLWTNVDVIAVELNPQIAKIYQDFFPQDKVIVADAHQYLLEHFKEFDFIWSSPPCPSHSRLRKQLSVSTGAKPIYPDMKLYEEILFLEGYFLGKWIVENVKSWYEPLIKPQLLQRHYFWTNFLITPKEFEKDSIRLGGWGCKGQPEWIQVKHLQERHKIFLPEDTQNKRTLLRNCVSPELGLHILNESKRGIQCANCSCRNAGFDVCYCEDCFLDIENQLTKAVERIEELEKELEARNSNDQP